MTRCVSLAPGDHPDSRQGCQLDVGHPGVHRRDQLTWHDPPLILVGGVEPDLDLDSRHWRGRNVRLTKETHD